MTAYLAGLATGALIMISVGLAAVLWWVRRGMGE